jgi:Nif-specific regulatory protein
MLAEHFMAKYAPEHQRPAQRLSHTALDLLMQYHWPGNVRELENVIERSVLVCDDDTITSAHLPATLQPRWAVSQPDAKGSREPFTERLSLSNQVENLEKELIVEALQLSRGNQSQAAGYLDTSLRILGYKIKRYGIDPWQYRAR